MKHSSIKIIFSSALIFMCSTAGVAQEHVVEAYADFSKVIAADNSMITMNKTVCYRDKTTSQITGNCSVVEFR
ncbi:MAG: hypothetical protein IK092_05640, partial [Muribaculaceae bacterium]|nr:hypothetical protein [Muribaculaceae bacterium]